MLYIDFQQLSAALFIYCSVNIDRENSVKESERILLIVILQPSVIHLSLIIFCKSILVTVHCED